MVLQTRLFLTDTLEDEEVASTDEADQSSSSNRPVELYSEDDVVRHVLRFSVGDVVECTVGDGEKAQGEVVQRFYREDEWPKGHYAAVRATLEAAASSTHALSLAD